MNITLILLSSPMKIWTSTSLVALYPKSHVAQVYQGPEGSKLSLTGRVSLIAHLVVTNEPPFVKQR